MENTLSNPNCCKDLLDEVKKYNKIDVVVQGLQLKFSKESRDSIREVEDIFESIKKSTTGGRIDGGGGDVIDVDYREERPSLANKINLTLTNLQQVIGNLVDKIAGLNTLPSPSSDTNRIEPVITTNRLQSSLNPVQLDDQTLERLPSSTNMNTVDYLGRIEPKSLVTSKNNYDVSDAKNVRDIPNIADTPEDKILIETKKQTETFNKLLKTNEKSLEEQKLINKALKENPAKLIGYSDSKQTAAPASQINNQSSSGGSVFDSVPERSRGRRPRSKGLLGGAVSGLSRLGGVAGSALSGLAGAAKFAGPLAAVAGAAYGGYQGFTRAGEVFGVNQDEATTGQKLSSAVGGITDPFGLGYGDSIAKGIYGAGEGVSNFFGGIKDKIVGTAQYINEESNRDLSYGGVGSISSEQKIATASSLNDQSEQVGNKYDLQKSSYQSGTTAQKSLFGSSMLGSLFSKEGQTTGQFISDSSKQERLIGNAAELGLGSDVNVDYEKRNSSDLLGERISSGSMFKKDKYKVTNNQTGQELELTKDEYKKLEALAAEGKADEAQKLFDEINARQASYVPEEGIMPEERMGTPAVAAAVVKKQGQPVGPLPTMSDIPPDIEASVKGAATVTPAGFGKSANETRLTTAKAIDNAFLENSAMRDEMAMKGGTTQPIVANNVQTNNNTTYMPMKADPRPTHRGSALDRYNERIAAF